MRHEVTSTKQIGLAVPVSLSRSGYPRILCQPLVFTLLPIANIRLFITDRLFASAAVHSAGFFYVSH